MFDLWMRLLDGVPDSVLWLLAHHDSVRANLRREAANRGVDPGRIVVRGARTVFRVLEPAEARGFVPGHSALQRRYDRRRCAVGRIAAVDLQRRGICVPNGGQPFARRGVPELIAADLAQYEMIALDLARNRPRLDLLRRRLAENRGARPLRHRPLQASFGIRL